MGTFEEHFGSAFVCAGLDSDGSSGGDGIGSRPGGSFCWPLFNVSMSPRWLGVAEGFHTLNAAVSHPNTGEAIPESWAKTRAFLTFGGDTATTSRDGRLLLGDSKSVEGGGGGRPKVPSLVEHVVVEVTMNGHMGQGEEVTHVVPVQRTADFQLLAERFCQGAPL